MVLLASTYDQSRFLRAEDLKQEKILRIKAVTIEKINDRTGPVEKLVVWFTNIEKGLVLNKTNNRTIRGVYHDDTAGWAGKPIVLYPTMTEMGGAMKPALRVRIPPPKQASDNARTAKRSAQFDAEAARPIPTPEQNDDFDDEIPV